MSRIILLAHDHVLAERLEIWLAREHRVLRAAGLPPDVKLPAGDQWALVWAVASANDTAMVEIELLSRLLIENGLAGCIITGQHEEPPGWAEAMQRRDPRVKLVFPAAPAAMLVTVRSVLHDPTFYS